MIVLSAVSTLTQPYLLELTKVTAKVKQTKLESACRYCPLHTPALCTRN